MDDIFPRFFPGEADPAAVFLREVRDRVPPRGCALDLGCGDNRQLAALRHEGKHVWGTDCSRHPGLAHPGWFRPLGGDGTIPFPDGVFDVVACRWVFEHVRDPGCFGREVFRVLRPGGCLLALSIDGRHYVSWLSRLLGLLPHAAKARLVECLYGRMPHDTFPTWYRLNSPAQLGRWARRAGLDLAAVRHFANPDYFSFSPLCRRLAVLADYALSRADTSLGKLYFVARLQKPGVPAALAPPRAA